MATPDDWFTCPNCGETVREGALSCPACGADEETGWSEMAEYDGLDLPEPLDSVESDGRSSLKRAALPWLSLLLLLAIVLLLLMGVW